MLNRKKFRFGGGADMGGNPGVGGGADSGAGSGFGGGGRRGQTRHERSMDRFGGRGGNRRGESTRQQMYPGIRPGEKPREYRQRMENQRRQAAVDAERKAREEAARKAKEEAARRAQQEQQRLAQEAAARQAAEARAAQEAAAAKAAEEARKKAEQERLAAIEEQRRKDAEEAAKQRQAQAQGITAAAASLNRPASPLRQYSGYTPLDYDVSKTGSLTDQYARMLNVPFFQPFIAQEDINLAPGATAEDSIFGIDSLLPNYTFDPLSQTASNPYFSARQGGRVQKDMGGFIGFMDEPLNIMHPTTKIDVVDDGISSILKKYKEIRSEL